jgi:hypothetical protein
MKIDRKKANSKLVVLGGVSVVAAAIIIRMMWSGPQPAPAASVDGLSGEAPAISGQPSPNPAVAARVAWPADIARDPFTSDLVLTPAGAAPPTKAEPVVAPSTVAIDVAALAREKIELKGTVLGDRPLAMMNGRVFHIGQVFEGFKIVEIATNQITVEREGSRVVVEAR